MPPPAIPGLPAAVLLAQASVHLWHGKHEDVSLLLDGALAEARQAAMPGLELEVLGMMAFVNSYWSRTNHADDAAQRADALRRHKNLAIPPTLEFASAVRAVIAGDLSGRTREIQRILLPDAVGSDPGLPVALILGQADVLLLRGKANEARTMLLEAGRRVPPLLAVMRDVMLADLETSLGRPRAALRLLRNHRGTEFAILTAMASARACLALNDLHGAQDSIRSVLTMPKSTTPTRGSIDLDDYSGGFGTWSGTSFAAPALAGDIAARIYEQVSAAGTGAPGVAPEQAARPGPRRWSRRTRARWRGWREGRRQTSRRLGSSRR